MLTIKAVPLLGCSIAKTFEQARVISKKLDCYVEFKFNGVTCISSPKGSNEIGIRNYHIEIKNKESFKYAVDHD
jgi:hypothetical protein